jgi:hypothetical protein
MIELLLRVLLQHTMVKKLVVPIALRTNLTEIPFSGFNKCNIVTLRSKLAATTIRQGQESVKTL